MCVCVCAASADGTTRHAGVSDNEVQCKASACGRSNRDPPLGELPKDWLLAWEDLGLLDRWCWAVCRSFLAWLGLG